MNLRFLPALRGLVNPLGAQRRAASALVPLLLAPWLLAGCQVAPAGRQARQPSTASTQPAAAPSLFAAECDRLWHTDGGEALSDADYWLRAMQCAERMTPSQARAEAERQSAQTWDGAFRQSILLNSATISVTERRQSYQQLLEFRSQFPAPIYPLFKMWRQQQALRLVLADERSKNQKQQESNFAQIDTLRLQQIELQRQLDVTTRKLENLTEIERRLSARKQLAPDVPDNEDDGGASGAAGATPKGASGQ